MAYVKQTWENLPSTNTPITAERLNHMEDGIAEAWEHGDGGAGESLPIGSEIEFNGLATDIPTGWERTNSIVTNVWANQSPTENFEGQTINISLSDYDGYAIIWSGSKTLANVFNTGIIPINRGAFLVQTYYSNGVVCRERSLSVSTTGITFNDAKNNGTTDNSQCVPLLILGYNIGLEE